jgi:tetratricopeptide (TPR) repeat protein
MKSLFACATLAVIAALATPASASVTVLGNGAARMCYQAARDGPASMFAIRECDAAIEAGQLSNADRAATFVNRGVIHLQRRNASEALADFDAALAINPTIGEAHVNRGAALILLNRAQEAIQEISCGLELGTQDPHEAHFNRAVAYEIQGDLAAAFRDYSRAQELKPDWALPQVELARFSVARR